MLFGTRPRTKVEACLDVMERCAGTLVVLLLLAPYLVDRSGPPRVCHALSFRVLSWNVLAPVHAPPSKYPWTDPRHLDWSFRSTQIAQVLCRERPDVVCLQEVQLGPCWEELYYGCNLDKVYECVLQNVTRGHPVANAVLLRRDGPLSKICAVESRSRALIVVLEIDNNMRNDDGGGTRETEEAHTIRSDSRRFVALANVHLEAGMNAEQDETRLYQLQSLLNRINHHRQALMKASSTADPGTAVPATTTADRSTKKNATTIRGPEVIIMGDWNMLPDSPMYRLLSTGQLLKDPTNLHRRVRLPLPLLPLRDAFALAEIPHRDTCSPGSGRDAACTYSGGCILDYVWVSKDVSVQRTWIQEPVTQQPGEATDLGALRRRRKGRRLFLWPDSHHPSDHLAIGATLQLSP
jgi:endonuclease/exonuclease/phosphatase family metal-dependent hydrolase